MTHTKVNYRDVEPVAGGMYFLRDPLDCEAIGVTVLEPGPGWSGKEHDHAEDDHEEVYLLLEGEATVEVDGREVALDPGDALRVDPEASRRIVNGDADSRLVLIGADT